MANEFLSEPNCIAVWRFEEGLMLVDETGDNGLSYQNPGSPPLEDTTVFHEGACAAQQTLGNEEAYEIDDGDLSEDFPLKDAGGTTFSWVGWVYIDFNANSQYVFGKMDTSWPQTAFYFKTGTDTWAFLSGSSAPDTGISATDGAWHHVGVTHDSAINQLTIRVYDEDGDTVESYQTTLTGGGIVVADTKTWMVGDPDAHADWRLDEVAVFDDVLTPAEIDQIRQGTYTGGGGGTPATGIATLDEYTAMTIGCPF